MAGLSKERTEKLKERVHSAAKHGMAISIFAVLYNMDKAVVKDILSHVTEDEGQKTTPLVAAAMGGATKVVQVLLTNFEVDLEQRATVRFDGYVIQEATALWCAAGAGHLDIVKLLIKKGACVNSKTATNSTPLRAACFDGHLAIVKYLLEQGADLTIPNKYNNTCLMISCYKGHAQVVRHLLEKGANPDLKAHCGATSIHFAAECGRLEVVKELVRFKAAMLVNDLGMTPLMVAAECGREHIVSFFLTQPDCSRLARIEALELLGASFANDKETYDLAKTYNYLLKAMALRMVDNRLEMSSKEEYQGIIEKPNFEPIPAYGNHRECRTLRDVELLQNNRDALHMEALTIRERILGSKNPEIPHPVIFRGAVFADNGRFDRCIALWMHAMVLRQVNGRSIHKDLLRFSQVFSQMVTISVDLEFKDVENVIHHGLAELQNHQKAGLSSLCEKSSSAEMYQANILSMIYLITIALSVVRSAEQMDALYRLIYKFLKINPCLKNGYTPLHIILDPMICVDDFHVNSVVVFPDKKTVSAFLACGADVDALDSSRCTALHVITDANLRADKETTRQDIIKMLLEHGAHCDVTNSKGETPHCLASGPTLNTLLTHGNVTLRCLAARCIRSHNIPFKDHIPRCLEEFVEWH